MKLFKGPLDQISQYTIKESAFKLLDFIIIIIWIPNEFPIRVIPIAIKNQSLKAMYTKVTNVLIWGFKSVFETNIASYTHGFYITKIFKVWIHCISMFQSSCSILLFQHQLFPFSTSIDALELDALLKLHNKKK